MPDSAAESRLRPAAAACPDCYTWAGPRGSAHDPHDPQDCPMRPSVIRTIKQQIADLRRRLVELGGNDD